MNKKTVQRQLSFAAQIKRREAGEGGESRTIEGYALLFGVRSCLLCDWWNGKYYEVLEPGCVTREMLDSQDIKLTMFHDRTQILARSKNGEGTLSYEIDGKGVKFTADMPKTAEGDKALELIGRGDLTGCSFMYSTDEGDSVNCVSYERIKDDDGEDVLLRHVKRIDNVYDFTIAADPAYEETSVTKREVETSNADIFGKKDDNVEQKRLEREQMAKRKESAKKKRETIDAVKARLHSIL